MGLGLGLVSLKCGDPARIGNLRPKPGVKIFVPERRFLLAGILLFRYMYVYTYVWTLAVYLCPSLFACIRTEYLHIHHTPYGVLRTPYKQDVRTYG